jgi:hypothetical protein
MKTKLFELLDHLAKRPSMHVGTLSVATVKSYLHGLYAGCELAGMEYTSDEYYAAAQSLGWDPRGAIGVLRDFQRNGLTEDAIIRELIAIERAAYALAFARRESQPRPATD